MDGVGFGQRLFAILLRGALTPWKPAIFKVVGALGNSRSQPNHGVFASRRPASGAIFVQRPGRHEAAPWRESPLPKPPVRRSTGRRGSPETKPRGGWQQSGAATAQENVFR